MMLMRWEVGVFLRWSRLDLTVLLCYILKKCNHCRVIAWLRGNMNYNPFETSHVATNNNCGNNNNNHSQNRVITTGCTNQSPSTGDALNTALDDLGKTRFASCQLKWISISKFRAAKPCLEFNFCRYRDTFKDELKLYLPVWNKCMQKFFKKFLVNLSNLIFLFLSYHH